MGLKIKLPNGTEGITTVTHGFVRTNQSAVNLKLGIFELYTRLKKALSSFHYYCPKLPYINTTTRSLLTNNPLGKDVFLLDSMEHVYLPNVKKFFYLNANVLTFKVGIIGVTYDNPSHILPYPIGYQHDLSLII